MSRQRLCWVAGSAVLLVLFPLRSMLVAVFVVFLACVVHGLRRLAEPMEYVAEQVTSVRSPTSVGECA